MAKKDKEYRRTTIILPTASMIALKRMAAEMDTSVTHLIKKMVEVSVPKKYW